MVDSLISKDQFIGLEGIANLATGGESPMLKSHRQAVDQFMLDKATGENARYREDDAVQRASEKCARLFTAEADEITFLSSASEGINNVVYGLEWKPGDNVVVCDVEFPSGVYPWTKLQAQGVELRIVRHVNWFLSIDDIARQIDHRTRVVAISQVSMFTGQRMDIARISRLVRESNALFLVDATHAAGVIPVDASHADIMVSSCYKWLMGTHGCAVFYWNREHLPEFDPPFLGWNSAQSSGGWQNPAEYQLHGNANRFVPGNPAYISIYILNNALDHILDLGIDRIESHALSLSGEILNGVRQQGWELMTSEADRDRAGNVSFMAPDIQAFRNAMEQQGVLVWGAYASFDRIRISTHIHNDSEDIERCLRAFRGQPS